MAVGGVLVLAFAALAVWAFIRSKGTDGRIDAWLAQAQETPLAEPPERR